VEGYVVRGGRGDRDGDVGAAGGMTWLPSMGKRWWLLRGGVQEQESHDVRHRGGFCVVVLFVVSSGLVQEVFCGIWNSGYQFKEEATSGEWKLISLESEFIPSVIESSLTRLAVNRASS